MFGFPRCTGTPRWEPLTIITTRKLTFEMLCLKVILIVWPEPSAFSSLHFQIKKFDKKKLWKSIFISLPEYWNKNRNFPITNSRIAEDEVQNKNHVFTFFGFVWMKLWRKNDEKKVEFRGIWKQKLNQSDSELSFNKLKKDKFL